MAAKQANMVQKVCFTLNNYTPEEYQFIVDQRNLCKFLVLGKEVGAEGTPHLQGYANFVKRTRFTALKKLIPRAHFEVALGTDQQNLAYCSKSDKNPFIHGEPQASGKRNDLKAACDAVLEKKTLPEVAAAFPAVYVRYPRGIEHLVTLLHTKRDVNDPPLVLWLWGKAGVGKTRFAFDQLSHDQIYIKDGTQWWDGYSQQQCILIDDFDGKWPFRDFLRLLDRYPYRGQTKGGYVEINSPIIIITCEFSPDHFWGANDLSQVTRRVSHTVDMGLAT